MSAGVHPQLVQVLKEAVLAGMPKVIGQIIISKLANGQVIAHYAVPGREAMNGMMTTAHQDMMRIMLTEEAQAAQGIQVPSPEMIAGLNGHKG
jgi:hypothetical protein